MEKAASISTPPHVLVLAVTDVARDARVQRQIRALAKDFRITYAAAGCAPDLPAQFIPLEMFPRPRRSPIRNRTYKGYRTALLALGKYHWFYWQQRWVRNALTKLTDVAADLILANDLDTLPLGLRIARARPVVFDAHEFYPDQHKEKTALHRHWTDYLESECRRSLPNVAAMMTVSPGIADEYRRRFGVESQLVENCPAYADISPSPVAHGRDKIQLVHHGSCRMSRGLGKLVELMQLLDDRFELTFMLVGDRNHRNFVALHELASHSPRIRFLEPVSPDELPHMLNRFDLGVYLLDPTCLNHRLALPNKFFDFIQARLGIAIGPSPEMARIVNERQLGVVSDDFTPEALARRLNALSPQDIARFKQNSNAAAADYCADKVRQRICDVVHKVLNGQ